MSEFCQISSNCEIFGTKMAERINCNSLFYGMSQKNFVQRVQNRAARIVCGVGQRQQNPRQLRQRLHWLPLPVRARTNFKLATLAFQSRVTGQPDYLAVELHYKREHCLRSSSQKLLTVLGSVYVPLIRFSHVVRNPKNEKRPFFVFRMLYKNRNTVFRTVFRIPVEHEKRRTKCVSHFPCISSIRK